MSYNLQQSSGTEVKLEHFAGIATQQQSQNPFSQFQPNFFSLSQQPQFEFIVKAEIQKYFNGVEIFMQSDIVSRFGSYMTGIDMCIIYNNKLIAMHLKQTIKTDIKNLTHFVFCANRIISVNPYFKLYMIYGSKIQPTKNFVDLMNDFKISSVISEEQLTFLNQLMQVIYSMLVDTSVSMEIC